MPEHQNPHPQILLDPHEADERTIELFERQAVETLIAKFMDAVRSLERKGKPAS